MDNGKMPPLLTQPPYKSPTLVDTPDAPGSPPSGSQEDVSDTNHLASECNCPGDRLTASDNKLFGVYQDWVHQNPGTYLDGGIE